MAPPGRRCRSGAADAAGPISLGCWTPLPTGAAGLETHVMRRYPRAGPSARPAAPTSPSGRPPSAASPPTSSCPVGRGVGVRSRFAGLRNVPDCCGCGPSSPTSGPPPMARAAWSATLCGRTRQGRGPRRPDRRDLGRPPRRRVHRPRRRPRRASAAPLPDRLLRPSAPPDGGRWSLTGSCATGWLNRGPAGPLGAVRPRHRQLSAGGAGGSSAPARAFRPGPGRDRLSGGPGSLAGRQAGSGTGDGPGGCYGW